MSLSYSIDDTQPRSPFNDDPAKLKPTINPEEDTPPRGGCLTTGFIVGMMLLVAVAIVALSGAAGWTQGQRLANGNATATQNAAINEQLQRIPADIDGGNLVLLDTRLRWLATQTPGVSGIGDYMMTATALYLGSLPTATSPAPATQEATAEPLAATEEIVIATEGAGGYDLARILSQAQGAITSSQWEDAIELLDVILGADPTFETQTVRNLMVQSLNSYARELYNANEPARANLLVNRAEEFGPLAEGLSYERYAAELFLTARAAVGTGSPAAINALQEVLSLGAGGRYYIQAQQLLYDAYVARGDAYVGQNDTCSAALQYQNAVNVLPSGVANGKLSAARTACENATPTLDPNLALPTAEGFAPVGVVTTPGS